MAKRNAKLDPKTVKARPTKSLFIDMLTRDIGLIPAIIDLVDNSTDGAQRDRGAKKFNGLWARVSFSSTEFKIADNCGGMDIDTARNHAFRFGRASGAPAVKHSVGQFGVGMKRALFKMGKQIHIESTTTTSRFVLKIDVSDWEQNDENWDFRFDDLQEGLDVPSDECGTVITVTELRDSVSKEFELDSFENDLTEELKLRIVHPLSRGLAITVNEIPLGVEPLVLLDHASIRPAHWKKTFSNRNEKPVKVKLYCGLGKAQEREMAGWHAVSYTHLTLPTTPYV